MTTHSAIKVHPKDNIIVALRDLEKGSQHEVNGCTYTVQEPIQIKHKFADHDFAVGDEVFMYGVLVGTALKEIPQGHAITTENCEHASADFDNTRGDVQWQGPSDNPFQGGSFKGFLRSNGDVGTANYWLVVPLVFCQNRNLDFMREAMLDALGYAQVDSYKAYTEALVEAHKNGDDLNSVELGAKSQPGSALFPNIDGVQFLRHQMGCGGDRGDAQALCGLLAGYITHPNVAGVTVLSLGCQNAQVALLQEEIAKRESPLSKPILIFEQQQFGNEEKMLSAAIKETFQGLVEANKTCERSSQPLSKLCIGVECGGSDGFSGISANPTMGQCIDLLVSIGGSGILSEFPELCGVEGEIVNRCVDQGCADKFVELINAYKAHAATVNVSFSENPSPGNIADGLITDAMKSAGAAKKGGTSPVTEVLDYPEQAKVPGLRLLNTPGNDVESTTALAAGGATMILFSTGLGTPTGNPIVPVLKVATNSLLAERMHDIIDFNTGPIIEGNSDIEALGKELLGSVQKCASGEYVSKAQRLGQFDFQPWKRGVSL